MYRQIDFSHECARLHIRLRQHRIAKTQQRDRVYLAFKGFKESTRQEMAIFLAGTVGKTAVYDAIKVFLRAGILRELTGSRLALTDHFTQHHHTLRCRQCGKITGFNNASLEKLVAKLATNRNFLLESHTFELNGLCAECHGQPVHVTSPRRF